MGILVKIYGEEKKDSEVVKFVFSYVDSVKKTKNDRYHIILSLIPNGGKYILDYGCGWGHYSVAARNKGNIVKAIDISENEIDICELVWGKTKNLKFESRAINTFKDKSFDCVLSSQVIEHVHNVGNYLSEINRVLKKKGQLIIGLPNIVNPRYFLGLMKNNMEEKLKSLSERILNNYDKTHNHINGWDPTLFVTLCSSVGFLLEKYIPTEGVAFPFRKPFKPYVYTSIKRFKNLSYTMVFSFKKVCDVNINSCE